MKIANIFLTIILIVAGSFLPGFAGKRCNCCGPQTIPGMNCSDDNSVNYSLIKHQCCCSVKSAECDSPVTLGTPPLLRFKIDPSPVKYDSYDALISSFNHLSDNRVARDGPLQYKTTSRNRVPIYLLHCSILC